MRQNLDQGYGLRQKIDLVAAQFPVTFIPYTSGVPC